MHSSSGVAMPFERIQTGPRMDKTLLEVSKGLADFTDLSLADLVEGLLLHALEGKAAITDPATLDTIDKFREIYGLELTADDSHRHPEPEDTTPATRAIGRAGRPRGRCQIDQSSGNGPKNPRTRHTLPSSSTSVTSKPGRSTSPSRLIRHEYR